MAKVVILKCSEYSSDTIKNVLSQGIDMLGGIDNFVQPGEKILLKPNILIGDKPAKCTTTHPAILQAAGELFKAKTDEVWYGDSPAPGMTLQFAKSAGFVPYAEKAGIKLKDFKEGTPIRYEEAVLIKDFVIANAVLEADGVISLCKMKTHGLTRITGAVKNQFGCVPGMLKSAFHTQLPDIENFAKMLVDLNSFINPRLYIMDGIFAMQGNGPRSGSPYPMNLILLSTDPIALDAAFCRIINMNPEFVPTITAGYKAGAGTYLEQEITYPALTPLQVSAPDFAAERSHVTKKNNSSFANNLLIPKPVIDHNSCIKCGACVNICPTEPKSLIWENKDQPPEYNYKTCISCFCCQEMCPEDAVQIKKPPLRKLIDFIRR